MHPLLQQNRVQRFIDIDIGKTISAGNVEMGWHDDLAERSVFVLRKLRVAPTSAYVEKLTMMLTLPSGIQVGPIDVPFTLNVETPVVCVATCPTPSAVQQRLELILSNLPDSPNLYGATYLAQPPQNVDTPIFDAVVAITIYSGATVTFKDGAGNTIGTATGSQLIARPRLAKTIASNATTPAILFHY